MAQNFDFDQLDPVKQEEDGGGSQLFGEVEE